MGSRKECALVGFNTQNRSIQHPGYCLQRVSKIVFKVYPVIGNPRHRWNLPRRNKMQANSLRDLYVAELRDLYNAETQLVKALPKMAKASSNAELRQGFEEHLRQTS
jgi:hypothetical protein